MRHVIDDREAAREVVGRDEGAVRGEEGAHVGEGGNAQRREAAVAVESECCLGDAVARLVVAHEGFRAGRGPAHGSGELARGDEEGGIFGIARGLHPEAAADVAGEHAQPILGHAEGGGELVAQHLRTLRAGIEGPALRRRIVACQGPARLERGDDETLAHKRQARDRCGGGEAQLDRARIAVLGRGRTRPVEGKVAGCFGPELGCARRDRVMEIDDRGKGFVIHGHELGAIEGKRLALGDDKGDRLAHMLDAIEGKCRPVRDLERRAAAAGEGAELRDVADQPFCHVDSGEHGEHTRCGECRRDIDAADACRGVGRAQEDGHGLPGTAPIVAEASAPGEKGRILDAAGPGGTDVRAGRFARDGPAHKPSSEAGRK